MSMYRYNGTDYTLPEIRALFPQVSIPDQTTAAMLEPLGVTILPDVKPTPAVLLAEARASKLLELSERFLKAEREGHFASSLGFEVDANERANRDVQGLITMLEATGQADVIFCDYGNVMQKVSLAQLKALQLEIISYGQLLYSRKWELRSAIEATESPEAVAGIEINFDTITSEGLGRYLSSEAGV